MHEIEYLLKTYLEKEFICFYACDLYSILFIKW